MKLGHQIYVLLISVLFNSAVHATTYVSPWSEGQYLDTLRMNADLSQSRDDFTKLTSEAYEYALLNAYNQKASLGTSASVDSISNTWPQVVLTDMDAYYCGLPVADLVHHSTVWAPAILGLTRFVQKTQNGSIVLTTTEKTQITKIVSVAMNGLNFFVGRDLSAINSTSKAFLYKVPSRCSEDQNLHGKIAPLNYQAAAGRLALELEQFFNLPKDLLRSLNSGFADNQEIYLNNMRKIVDNTKSFGLSQIKTDSSQASYWAYMPNGRIDDNSHAAIVVNWLVRMRRLGRIDAQVVYNLIGAFNRQYSTGPTAAYSHLNTTFALDRRGTYYATKALVSWTELIVYKCKDAEFIAKFDNLLNTAVPDHIDRTKFYFPRNVDYIALKVRHAKAVDCRL